MSDLRQIAARELMDRRRRAHPDYLINKVFELVGVTRPQMEEEQQRTRLSFAELVFGNDYPEMERYFRGEARSH